MREQTRGRETAGWRRMATGAIALAMLAGGVTVAWQGSGSTGARAQSAPAFRDEHVILQVPFEGQWYNVQVDMFVEDDGSPEAAAEIEAARREIAGRFPGAVVAAGTHEETGSLGLSVEPYVLNSYWWPARTASWKYNASGKPAALAGDGLAMLAGANAWGQVGANWSFTGGSTTSAATGACNGSGLDKQNTVGWRQQSGSVLAVTCTWYQGGTPGTAVEFDMEFSPSWNWTTGSTMSVDVNSVATHEFGHALGLGHSADAAAVMYYAYTVGNDKRVPRADDVAAILARYGTLSATATPTTTSAAPTATATLTSTPTSTPTSAAATATPTRTVAAATSTPTKTATTAPTKTPTPRKTATATKTPKPPTPTPTSKPARRSRWGRFGAAQTLPQASLITWDNETTPTSDLVEDAPDVVLYSYDPATGKWLRFGPQLPGYINTLSEVREGAAYWMLARN